MVDNIHVFKNGLYTKNGYIVSIEKAEKRISALLCVTKFYTTISLKKVLAFVPGKGYAKAYTDCFVTKFNKIEVCD